MSSRPTAAPVAASPSTKRSWSAPRFDRTPALAGGPRYRPRHTPMSDTFSKVEVITGVARRRRFSTDLKLAVVAETMQPGMSISYVARRHGLSPSLVFRWRRLMSEGAAKPSAPMMRLCLQLRSNSYPGTGLAHRAFEHIPHAELAPDLLYVRA